MWTSNKVKSHNKLDEKVYLGKKSSIKYSWIQTLDATKKEWDWFVKNVCDLQNQEIKRVKSAGKHRFCPSPIFPHHIVKGS